MQFAAGNCVLEEFWRARGTSTPEILERFPCLISRARCWLLSRPSPRWCQKFLARQSSEYGGDLGRWRIEGGNSGAVRFADKDGKEICRWTAADAYEELAPSRRQTVGACRDAHAGLYRWRLASWARMII